MDLQTIMWATTKIVAALFVLFLWIKLFQRRIVPHFKVPEGESPKAPKRPFPYLPLGGLIVLSVATLWFAQAEMAYREVWSTPDRSIDRERAAERRNPAEVPSVQPDNRETLEERTKRLRKEAEEGNERTKEEFRKLKPSSP
jgi:hypothetical protein